MDVKTGIARHRQLEGLLRQRIVILDGAMGTMIQALKLSERDFRGREFAAHPRDLQGANDILSLTQPAAIRDIHAAYAAAGADIVETNTFNASAVALAEYGLAARARDINLAAAGLARAAAAAAGHPCFVAGAMGPMNKTLSISRDVNDPGRR